MSTAMQWMGRSVNRIGFGAMQLPGPGVMGPPRDHDAAIAVLRHAVEAGVNHIDTADFYGPHVANELIREALHPYADDLLIVSKVGASRDETGGWLPAQSPQDLRQGVEDNLRSLRIEQVPVMNLRHMPADPEHPQVTPVDFADQVAEMVSLRDDGLIGAFGVSTVDLQQAQLAIEAGAVCVQNAFSLVAREDEPVRELCTRHDVAYVPYFPLGSAFPHLPKVIDQPAVVQVAQRVGATPAQVGLAWLLHHAPNILLIPGTSSLSHLSENLAVDQVQLSAEDVAQLEASPA